MQQIAIIVLNSHHIPNVSLSPDRLCVSVNGVPIVLADVRRMLHGGIEDLEIYLKTLLLGCEVPEELESAIAGMLNRQDKKKQFRDNLFERHVGYSIFTDEKCPLSKFRNHFLNYLMETNPKIIPEKKQHLFHQDNDSELEFDRDHVAEFFTRCEGFMHVSTSPYLN